MLDDGRVVNRFTYQFGDDQRVTKAIDERGVAWTYTFDGEGRLLSEQRQGANPVRYEYTDPNNLFNRTQVTDETGRVWRYQYDERRNVTRLIEPDGSEKRFTWEPVYNRW